MRQIASRIAADSLLPRAARTASVITIGLLVAWLPTSPVSAGEETPDFSGSWELDQDLSEDPMEKMREQRRGRGGGMGGGRGGGMGGGRGGGMGGGGWGGGGMPGGVLSS